jgi:hypothetical protein
MDPIDRVGQIGDDKLRLSELGGRKRKFGGSIRPAPTTR